jgi:protein tyrosine phosphatase (PTP) superfamily phosphohydrolase (DUF442 family)
MSSSVGAALAPPPNAASPAPSAASFRRLRRVLILLGLFGGGAFLWNRSRDNLAVVVSGRLVRSAQPEPGRLEEWVRRLGIRSVINLRGAWPEQEWFRVEDEECRRLGLPRRDVAILTHRTCPPNELRQLLQAFDELPAPILIHCRRGSDRTGLATAIHGLLFEGKSLSEAEEALTVVRGHVGIARGWLMPSVLDEYRRWLDERGEAHRPDRFRRFIAEADHFGPYAAEIQPLDLAEPLPAGQPVTVTVRLTNRSRHVWHPALGLTPGLSAHGKLEPQGDAKRLVAALGFERPVPPGDHVDVRVTFPAQSPGNARLFFDLTDAEGMLFCEVGRGGWSKSVEFR